MYAVIESGGKQYRVELGTRLEVDRLEVEPGQTIEFERVLLVADGDGAAIGRPLVDGARVRANVIAQDRGEKIVVFKYKPKARHRVKHGHRAELTVVQIADIVHGGRSAAQAIEHDRAERERASAEAAQAAERQAAADLELAERLARAQAAAEVDGESTRATRTGVRRRAIDSPTAADANTTTTESTTTTTESTTATTDTDIKPGSE